MKKIFLTGGSGYIGSHACIELLNRGYAVIIYDNLTNSSIKVLDRIKQITKYRCQVFTFNQNTVYWSH